jgi:hypothetical protein
MVSLLNNIQTLQLLVVITSNWNAHQGFIYSYQRNSSIFPWTIEVGPINVTIGQDGLAWGRGLEDFTYQANLIKKEGDKRSPAGIFHLGTIFGDQKHQKCAKKMPFLLITKDLEYVDDPCSRYYNQFVCETTSKRDWKSSEKMHEIGFPYALGLVIQHNHNPIKSGSGSAIFMHIWTEHDKGTAGCTAMAEDNLKELISWLDESKYPCIVQLPLKEYNIKKSQWKLPELP